MKPSGGVWPDRANPRIFVPNTQMENGTQTRQCLTLIHHYRGVGSNLKVIRPWAWSKMGVAYRLNYLLAMIE